MRTAEEILDTKREHGEYQNHYYKDCVLEAMEEYADQFRKPKTEKECKHEIVTSAAGFQKCFYCNKYFD